VKSVLIVRLGSLGDVVHAIPAAAALRIQFPSARIDWLVEPQYEELLELVEPLDDVVPIDTRRFAGAEPGVLRTVRRLRAAGYDVVLDLQGLLKSAVLARAAGGRRTIGFPRAHLREPAARYFYSGTPDPGPAVHVVHKNLALLASLGVRDTTPRFPLKIVRAPAVLSVVERLGAGGYALINPGAAWPNKRWPAARFGALAAALRRELHLTSLVLWGPGEEPLAAAVVAASEGAAELAPPTTIVDIVALARDARVMVSGDTGPLHLGGAVGTPLVALFGPTRPERNGPWAVADLTVSRVDRCSCLYERRCRLPVPCIDDIGVDEVMEAVRRRLGVHG
jgi:lipopolysaccharide heptosyltransferase I